MKAAAGAKIRGEGRGEFSKFKTTDLLEEIKEILTGEKAQFLSELFSQQPGEEAEEEKTQNTDK